jgi:hypothetical protein
VGLLRPGVQLDLICLGQLQSRGGELFEMGNVEVAHADRPRLALPLQFDQAAPLGEPLLALERRMDQVQIHLRRNAAHLVGDHLPENGKFAGGKALSLAFPFSCGPFTCADGYAEQLVQLKGKRK